MNKHLPSHHILFSVENPMHEVSAKVRPTTDEMVSILNNSGEQAQKVHGKYGSEEQSILVSNPKNANKIFDVARSLGQDSIIHSKDGKHEMHYLNGDNKGQVVTGSGTHFHPNKPEDYYTTMQTPEGEMHFTHNFDFPEAKKSEELEKGIKAYHGTTKIFNKFKLPKKTGTPLNYGTGIYASTNPKDASDFAGPSPHYRNPDAAAFSNMLSDHDFISKLNQKAKEYGLSQYNDFDHKNYDKFAKESYHQMTHNYLSEKLNMTPNVKRVEVDIKKPFDPHNYSHAKAVATIAGHPNSFHSLKKLSNDPQNPINFYDMLTDRETLGWNDKTRKSDFWSDKKLLHPNSASDLINGLIQAAGFDGIHNKKEGHVVAFHPTQIKSIPFGKSESLNKAPYEQQQDHLGQFTPEEPGQNAYKHADINFNGKNLEHWITPYKNSIKHHIVDPDNQTTIAYLDGTKVKNQNTGEKGLRVYKTLVHNVYQGMGLGKLVYGEAAKHHGTLWSDRIVSPKARGVYESFKNHPEFDVRIGEIKNKDPNPNEVQEVREEYGTPHILRYRGAKEEKLAASELEKMSRPRITFPNLPGISTRPDQEIKQIQTPKQMATFNKLFRQKLKNKYPEVADRVSFPRQTPIAGVHTYQNKGGPNLYSGYIKEYDYPVESDKSKDMASHIDHEGFHYTMQQIQQKYGNEAANKIIKDSNSKIHPETSSALRSFISTVYPKKYPKFNEEKIAWIHTLLTVPRLRQKFINAQQSTEEGQKHISNLKSAHNDIYKYAKSLTSENLQPKKLAASENIISGGKGDKKSLKDFNPAQVAMGLKVEMEHTDDKKIAEEITADHLSEDPNYYSKLKESGLADELEKTQEVDWNKYGIMHSTDKHGINYVHVHEKSPHGGGDIVAEFQFVTDHPANPNLLTPLLSEVDPNHRRKGIASAAYKYAEEVFNNKIAPATSQTQNARQLWNQPNRSFGKSEISLTDLKNKLESVEEDIIEVNIPESQILFHSSNKWDQ